MTFWGKNEENYQRSFWNDFKAIPRGARLTQEEFAAECEISRAYYGRLERGEHSATLELCEKIANYLDVTYAQLFEMLDD